MGTEQEAIRLAQRYGADVEKARRAALLHDCTKKLEMEEQLALCETYGMELDELEQVALKLLHSKTGAAIARDVFGVDDEIYSAIYYHTTGRAGMTLLEKIIYLADYIEPTRDFPDVDVLRKACYEDLDKGLLLGLEMSVLDTLKLFGYLSPFFMLIICPIACMLAVFLTFLRMSTDRELGALKAGGVSLYQMLPAPLVFSVFCALFGFWISFSLQAWGMGSFRSEVLSIASNSARIVVQPGVFNKDIPDMVMFARKADPISGTLADVMVEDRRAEKNRMTILAPEGDIDADYESGEIVFLLRNGRSYTENDKTMTMLGFKEYAVRFSIDSLFKGVDMGPVKPKEYSWERLYDYENQKKLSKRDLGANMSDYSRLGYAPEAVAEYLLTVLNSNFEEWRLGNADKPYTDFKFNINKMSVSGCLFDIVKLGDVSKNVVSKMTAEQVKQVMDVNFFGTYNCIYQVTPKMREQGYGRIVNISSTSSFGIGMKHMAPLEEVTVGGATVFVLDVAKMEKF